MILVEIHFGKSHDLQKLELEDIAENYIASLFHAGQLCGEYFLTWIGGELTCQTLMSGLDADKLRYHSPWSKPKLKAVTKAFGRKPVWKICDDDAPQRNISWSAPTLHLFTHAFDWKSPLRRGDTGVGVPVFLLPLDFQQKNDLIRWQSEYVLHDRLWLNSGSLEMSAYKELVNPKSELSVAGRELCAEIEKATSVPTYYFLMRFSAPEQGVDSRPCPGCGKAWGYLQPLDAPFHHWPFRCERCRLVSTIGVDVNRRRAKIGQWNASSK
jgi:predicted  nucleic acid-binding Zn ribbon protein